MKKLLIAFLMLVAIGTQAQYTTPGTAVNWNFDSLSNASNAVTKSGSTYQVNQNILLSLTDTLRIDSNIIVEFGSNVELEVLGSFISNPKDSAVLTATNSNQVYDQIRIDDSDGSYFNHTIFEYGGGLNVLNSDFTVENCVFRFNDANNDGAIDLFRSDLLIQNNHFYQNQGPAINSGANIASAPIVLNNRIEGNVANGGNKSQINFGATGTDTLIIKGNTIIGQYSNAGGVAIFPLGGAITIIDSNIIDGNRYGIAQLNSNNWSQISRNQISNNNTQGNPNLGGSGINFNGDASNKSIISENEIYGNLWGITIQNTAKPNIGDLRSASYNVGLNEIYNNNNGGNEYNIFNNTPDSIYAQNNIWNYANLTAVENTISHKPDDPSLGYVRYTPINALITALEEKSKANSSTKLYPNPSNSQFTVASDFDVHRIDWFNLEGKLVRSDKQTGLRKVELEENELKGQFFIRITGKNRTVVKKLLLK
ncbi:MAG: T9SS type A sorting domain-containing protein [Vicingaceae bacterium]